MRRFSTFKPKNYIAKVALGVFIALIGFFSFGIGQVKKAEDIALGETHTLSQREITDIVAVSSANALANVARRVNNGEVSLSIRLIANIDLSGAIWSPIGTASNVFAGTFDGNGYTISNLKIDETITNFGGVGFFGHTNNATIKDVMLVNPVIVSAGEAETTAKIEIGRASCRERV